MTIDEAIVHAREVASEQKRRSGICVQNNSECDKFSACLKCSKEHEQLAEWLEELKKRRNEDYGYLADIHQNIGYRKAIDDFAENIRTYYSLKQEMGYVATTYEDLINYIFELAEQLKVGGKNERSI